MMIWNEALCPIHVTLRSDHVISAIFTQAYHYTLSHPENDRDVTERAQDTRCKTHHLSVNPGVHF